MSVLSGVNKTRTTQAGQIKLKTTQQGVSQTQSHDLRGNALPSSMSDPDAKVIVVEHSDRLARFGVAHLQAALAEQGLRIVVADDSETTDDLVRAVTATKQPDPVEATG